MSWGVGTSGSLLVMAWPRGITTAVERELALWNALGFSAVVSWCTLTYVPLIDSTPQE